MPIISINKIPPTCLACQQPDFPSKWEVSQELSTVLIECLCCGQQYKYMHMWELGRAGRQYNRKNKGK